MNWLTEVSLSVFRVLQEALQTAVLYHGSRRFASVADGRWRMNSIWQYTFGRDGLLNPGMPRKELA